MEEYKLKIYSAAKNDSMKIIEYINDLLPKVAVNQYDRLFSNIYFIIETITK